jgi:predicted RNase H-like HicB family nuclease
MYQITLHIERLPEGVYLGTSPDLRGLLVQAETPEAVMRLAPDVARDLIEVMREHGVPVELTEVEGIGALPLIIAA